MGGALLLTVAGLLVKVIGMIYKIPLTNQLGDDGMGYFNTAYTVYTFFFVLSSSGLPTALSLSVSRELASRGEREAKKRYAVMARFSAWLGFSLFLLLCLLARPIAFLLSSPKAYLAILSVSPAIWFITAASAERGFWQGRRHMLPTALSQLVEAIGKLIFGLFMIALATRLALTSEKVAAYAILGLSFATFLTYLILKLFFREKGMRSLTITPSERRMLLLDTLKTAFPITVASLSATLASSLDLVLLMRSLQSIGYTPDAANAAWGNYSAMVLPLFHMPQVVLTPIALSILPALRGAFSKNDEKTAKALIKSALVITALVGALASLGLSLFAKDALSLIYTDEAAIAHAYPHLALLAIAIFPFGIMTVTASILQAEGRLWLPTVSLAIGALTKALVTLLFVESLGEAVSAIGTLVSYTVASAINFAALTAKRRSVSALALTAKPFLVASLSVAVGLLVQGLCYRRGIPESFATLVSIASCALMALVFTILTKTLTKDDLAALGVQGKK